MNTSTRNASPFEIDLTPSAIAPSAWALLAAIRTAADAGHAYPDLPSGDPRGDDIEELAAENVIEPVDPAEGGGWRAVAPE